MILESAKIKVQVGCERQFEAAVARAAPLFRRAPGCVSMQLQRSVEQHGTYFLLVQWETIEDHIVHFRQSDDFPEWRRLVGPYFIEAPEVQHLENVELGF